MDPNPCRTARVDACIEEAQVIQNILDCLRGKAGSTRCAACRCHGLSNGQNNLGDGDSAGGFAPIAGVVQAGFDAIGGMKGQCANHRLTGGKRGFYSLVYSASGG